MQILRSLGHWLRDWCCKTVTKPIGAAPVVERTGE